MKRRTTNRREAIEHMLAWSALALGGNLLTGCDPDPPIPACEPGADDPPLSWGPNVVTPVFYGYADYNSDVGAPASLRVYYPSLDGAPQCAPFLTGPGRFPLVVFLHGQCSASEFHYSQWSRLPAGLARAGYVVALPDLAGITSPWDLGNATYTRITDVIDWLRTGWSRRNFLMPPPTLGIMGHSYGALYGGQLATTLPATVYISIGGVWSEWPGSPPNPLNNMTIPKLVVHGTGLGAFAEGVDFNAVPSPKHRLVFADSGHWDYVPPSATGCDEADPAALNGDCDLVDDVAADMASIYLTKYMPPEGAGSGPGVIPDDLVPPAVTLTSEQAFFAGGHLASLGSVGSNPDCAGIALDWVTPGGSGSRSLS